MNGYYKQILAQKRPDYVNLVLPVLTKVGYNYNEMLSLFDKGLVRLRYGKDWKDFTVHLTNPLNKPVGCIDNLIHMLWKGITIPNYYTMTCFVTQTHTGRLTSFAIIDLYSLATNLNIYGSVKTIKNRYNMQQFKTIPFGHPCFSKSIRSFDIV